MYLATKADFLVVIRGLFVHKTFIFSWTCCLEKQPSAVLIWRKRISSFDNFIFVTILQLSNFVNKVLLGSSEVSQDPLIASFWSRMSMLRQQRIEHKMTMWTSVTETLWLFSLQQNHYSKHKLQFIHVFLNETHHASRSTRFLLLNVHKSH